MARLPSTSMDSENINMGFNQPTPVLGTARARHDVLLYLDGARTSDGKVEDGYVKLQARQTVATGSFSIIRQVKTMDTWLIAIPKVLFACMLNTHQKFGTNIKVLSDCQAAVAIIYGKKTNKCRKEIEEIRVIQRDWNRRERLVHVKAGIIFAKRTPSHSEIGQKKKQIFCKSRGSELVHVRTQGEAIFR